MEGIFFKVYSLKIWGKKSIFSKFQTRVVSLLRIPCGKRRAHTFCLCQVGRGKGSCRSGSGRTIQSWRDGLSHAPAWTNMDACGVIRHPGDEDEGARWVCGAQQERGPAKFASGPAPAVLRLERTQLSQKKNQLLLWEKTKMNFWFKFRGLSNSGKPFYFHVGPAVIDICAKFHVNVIICYIVTLVFSKRLKVIFSIFTMSEFVGQRSAIKFYL